eukprot:CAMPEP_0182458214 /NCGR_PEP_ID=MMETSP1319-20130603/3598_1 /TAXON_ID=172717 /ORGANISM="Bolidomonas pacifica, Strain RCC208" /LENGTH=380 /DNA_ID=CAMNT_0024656853 /DNA_START=245 /DNA_END=1387 /DNA_ORIENTATION=+
MLSSIDSRVEFTSSGGQQGFSTDFSSQPSSPQCEGYKADATVRNLEPDPIFTATQEYQEMLKYIEKRYDFKNMKEDFISKGFLVYKPEIPDDVLNGATDFTEQVLKRCATDGVDPADDCRNFHQDRFADVDSVRNLAMNYDIRAMLASLHGHEPYPFQTLNYPKSSLARTHSDYIHFAAHPLPLMSAAWVALQDIDPDSGPVFYFEGSHVINPYNMQDFGLEDRTKGPLNYAKYQDIVTAYMRSSSFPYKEAVFPKGWVLIWSSNLVHGGPPAKDPSLARLSQVTHYFFRNSNYNWAPVASDVDNDAITYYDEEAVKRKWGRTGTAKERREMSKFKIGPCDLMTRNKPNVPNPCTYHHKIPKVFSEIFEHKGVSGNDVIM